MPAEDFPHLAGAESGCFGFTNCHQVAGNLRQAAKQLVEGMEIKGYQVTPDDSRSDSGHLIYEVVVPSEPGESPEEKTAKTHYLNVFSPELGRMAYVMTLDLITLDQLRQLAQQPAG